MNSTESQEPKITAQDLKLLHRIKANPKLSELLERYDSEISKGIGGYEAELLVTELTRELGKDLMGEWTHATQEQAVTEEIKARKSVKNGKKNATSTPASE